MTPFFNHILNDEILFRYPHFPGLDFGDVQEVIDYFHQHLRADPDVFVIFQGIRFRGQS